MLPQLDHNKLRTWLVAAILVGVVVGVIHLMHIDASLKSLTGQ